MTFENEGWCVQTPGAFLYKSLLASFCLQYTSNYFFYRPYNFHFNILSSLEIIAKTLSVALEVSLSIFILSKNCHGVHGNHGQLRLPIYIYINRSPALPYVKPVLITVF